MRKFVRFGAGVQFVWVLILFVAYWSVAVSSRTTHTGKRANQEIVFYFVGFSIVIAYEMLPQQ